MRSLIIALLFFPLLAHAESACPTRFTEFLAMFEKSIEFQTLNIRFPLRYTYVDGNAEPEPKQIKVMVSRANISKHPGVRFPTTAVQVTAPLKRKLTSGARGTQIVQFDKPDSDAYSVAFHFSKTASCWQLVEVEDGSL